MPDAGAPGCDRLQLARAGAIQPFAALVAVDRDWRILCTSENLGAVLGTGSGPAVGQPLARILPQGTVHRLRGAAPRTDSTGEVARLFGLHAGGCGRADVALHAVPDGWVIEAEPARRAAAPLLGLVHRLADRARARTNLPALLDEAVLGLAALTGFDRVLAYRFEADASGRVVAETDAAGPPRFLGLRFPATDIPPQARALYARNLLRVIADTESPAVPLTPAAAAPDLTLSMARAVAPVHLDYLRAMGVRASMSVSLPGDEPGSLWGLLACHHPRPHAPDYATRSAVELYGQILGHEIAARRRAADRDAAVALERAARTAAGAGNARARYLLPEVQARLGCEGVALVSGRDVDGAGLLPGAESLRALAAAAATSPCERRATGAAGWGEADLALALPVSRDTTLILVRGRPRTGEIWAGNPDDAATAGPARSFAVWRASDGGRAQSLDPGEQALARGLAAQMATQLSTGLPGSDAPPDAARRRTDPAPDTEPLDALAADEARHRARHAFQLAAALARSTLPAAQADRMARALSDLARTTAPRADDPPAPQRLSRVIAAELRPWRPDLAGCGPVPDDDPVLPPDLLLPLTIAVHELAANAARHGALSCPGGRLHLRLCAGPDRAALLWVERDGPAPGPRSTCSRDRTAGPGTGPGTPGTGLAIIARALATVPGGRAHLRLGARGLVARLSFALPRGPARILVVEDDPLVAADLARMLADLGHGPCAIARSATDAARHIARASPAAVLCDLNLAPDSGWPIVALAQEVGIPVVIVTGADGLSGPAGGAARTVVTKPLTRPDLARALARVLQGGDPRDGSHGESRDGYRDGQPHRRPGSA